MLYSGISINVNFAVHQTHFPFKPWGSVKSGTFHTALLPVFLLSPAVGKPGHVVPMSDSLQVSGCLDRCCQDQGDKRTDGRGGASPLLTAAFHKSRALIWKFSCACQL